MDGSRGAGVDQTPPGGRDATTDRWTGRLASAGHEREVAAAELHAMLLRFARSQVNRRAARFHVTGPEADDIAHQATADAVVSILAKLDEFRGESRFTTWACKFVLLEVANKLGRHFWRTQPVPTDEADWDRLPDRFGLDPAREAEWRGMVESLRRGIDTALTDHQRRLFVSIVLRGDPLDAVVASLGSNRNAIYKTLFDARRKLRAWLVADGYADLDNRSNKRGGQS